jgi:arsenate reductase
MKATIWHNPRCSKSREALALLNDFGAEVVIFDYLNHPPSRAELASVYKRAGIAPRDAMRKDAPAAGDDDAALDIMSADPSTIERPVVETEKGIVLARPASRVSDIL